MNTRIALLLSAVALLAAGWAASADQVYRWVDKDGHVHYSQTPPAASNVDAQSLNISAAPPDPTSLRNEKREAQMVDQNNKQADEAAQKAKQDQQKQAQKKQQCDSLRSRLQILEQAGRVSTMDPQGNRTYLSDDDRTKQEQQLQDQIGQQCSGG